MKIGITVIWQKIILSTIAAIALNTAQSQLTEQPSKLDYKEIRLQEKYEQVELWGNVSVILTNSPADQLLVEGNRKDLNRVLSSIKRGKLKVYAGNCLAPVVVYVSTASLGSIVVNGDAHIYSSGPVRANDLNIILNGSSKVEVQYFGNLKITPGREYDLVAHEEELKY